MLSLFLRGDFQTIFLFFLLTFIYIHNCEIIEECCTEVQCCYFFLPFFTIIKNFAMTLITVNKLPSILTLAMNSSMSLQSFRSTLSLAGFFRKFRNLAYTISQV